MQKAVSELAADSHVVAALWAYVSSTIPSATRLLASGEHVSGRKLP